MSWRRGAHNGNFSYTQRQCDECEMSRKRLPTCKFDAFVLNGRARDLHFSPRSAIVLRWKAMAFGEQQNKLVTKLLVQLHHIHTYFGLNLSFSLQMWLDTTILRVTTATKISTN